MPDKLLRHIWQVTAKTSLDQTTEPLPSQIQAILDRYLMVLQPPSDLPPSRPCNHSIPLIPRAQLVFIHPYRCPSALKDEIEKQVLEMLSQDLIRPSSGTFSSPILLVKNKDGC